MRVVVILSLFAVALCAIAGEPELDERELLGVWKMVYAGDVQQRPQSELSSGFLIIMPGRKYYEIREDCCDPAAFMDAPRSYRIESGKVILSSRRADGSPYERTLHHLPAADVVFFDDLGKRLSTSILAADRSRSPNYGYGKVYP